MTTFFDRVQRLLIEIKEKITNEEYLFLMHLVDGVHQFQHSMNSHKLDGYLFEILMTSPNARNILKQIGYSASVQIFESKRNRNGIN